MELSFAATNYHLVAKLRLVNASLLNESTEQIAHLMLVIS